MLRYYSGMPGMGVGTGQGLFSAVHIYINIHKRSSMQAPSARRLRA